MRKNPFIIALFCLITIFACTGCVKVVPIGHEDEITGNKAFDASKNVEGFWHTQAVPELMEKAVELPVFLKEANGDLKSLAKQYGRYSMGDKGELSYVVKGEGIVTEINRDKKAGYMTIKVNGYDGPINIKLQIGEVYKGSAVRDSLSFIKYEDYKNQVDWAKVAQNIHNLINKKVIGNLDFTALQGKTVSFTGCFSVDGPTEILITPIELMVK